ncbi:hypothetical protein [Nitrospirillum bahiense]|uniref:hypothetical protein n=1 Tax=Nitrospirillum amazonense TaxID=28077 RepID=UPI0011A071EC|nr:hypothetical protein [Nitrospirillum amazonense]
MKLSAFIEETLYEIAIGIDRARISARKYAAINPSRVDGNDVTEKSYIDFDLSLVVTESEESNKKGDGRLTAEVQVVSFVKIGGGAGGQIDNSKSLKSEQTHRISFKVPVYLNANYRNNDAAEAEAVKLGYQDK